MPTSTYTPQSAIDLIKNFVHGIPLDAIAPNVCDMVHSTMWVYYPWSWSIASLTAINLTDGVQDFTPTNTDILRPLKVRMVRTDVSPNEFEDLAVLANLPPDLSRKMGFRTIKNVGWFGSQSFFRLETAVNIGATTTLQIQGEYQKVPTKMSSNTMNVVLPFPDYYFPVFVEGVKYFALALSDDPRAGGVQVARNGSIQKGYTGQWSNFMDMLLMMARTEDLGSGDQWRFPESGMGVGQASNPGLFGSL
jgi:hypothetical protein